MAVSEKNAEAGCILICMFQQKMQLRDTAMGFAAFFGYRKRGGV